MSTFMDRYKTDRAMEEGGVWVDYGGGLQVCVRRINSEKSKEVRRRLEKPYSKSFRGQDMPDSLAEELLNKQMAQAIIVDWKGVPNPDNPEEMLVFNEDNAYRMVSEFKDFREDILAASMERATFQREEIKAAEKNSKSSSPGS